MPLPTQQARNFLLTEALRGEGAYLKRPDGSVYAGRLTNVGNWRRDDVAPAPLIAR